MDYGRQKCHGNPNRMATVHHKQWIDQLNSNEFSLEWDLNYQKWDFHGIFMEYPLVN